MQLHELNAGSRKKRKRVGRGPGSGLGKTCGRVTKVQSPVLVSRTNVVLKADRHL